MKILRLVGVSLIVAAPLSAQAIYQPPSASIDLTNVTSAARQALTTAQNAQASADASVKTVNGASPTNGAITLDLSTYARIAALSSYITSAALTPYATTASVNSAIAGIAFPVTSVNGATGSVLVPIYTDAQAVAANAPAITALSASTTQFVAGGAFISQAVMRGSYPCASPLLGKYARVNDMYGNVSSVAICETDGSSFYWRPQRTDYSTIISAASGTVTLTPFQTAPVVYLPTTPTGGITVNLSTANVWPGASFRVYAPAALGTGAITLTNLVGGGTVPLLQGSDKVITYTSAGWKSN